MALHFDTKTPKLLLKSFKSAVDQGQVEAWSYDTDGDFTLAAHEWRRQAWLRPKIIERQELRVYILTPVETRLTTEAYAVYHSAFLEAMLQHCDSLFNKVSVSARAEEGDVVG